MLVIFASKEFREIVRKGQILLYKDSIRIVVLRIFFAYNGKSVLRYV